ncbi:hypothetical protein MHYP_G00118670 [Metynnis hypsauchen]
MATRNNGAGRGQSCPLYLNYKWLVLVENKGGFNGPLRGHRRSSPMISPDSWNLLMTLWCFATGCAAIKALETWPCGEALKKGSNTDKERHFLLKLLLALEVKVPLQRPNFSCIHAEASSQGPSLHPYASSDPRL